MYSKIHRLKQACWKKCGQWIHFVLLADQTASLLIKPPQRNFAVITTGSQQ